MTDNDLFYVCALIEYTSRLTMNRRGAIVKTLGLGGVKKQLKDASVNHCLSFEQVAEEMINAYDIKNGDFDTVTHSKYAIPDFQSIGKLYAIMIQELSKNDDLAQTIIKVFSSFISDEISDFSTDLYYQNPDYLICSYIEGRLL